MKEINLRDLYPYYTHDMMIEVPDEIALLFREYALLEEAYRIRAFRNKALYSLDQDEWIEQEVLHRPSTPEEVYEQKQMNEMLYKGLATLPEKQHQRICAHFFMGIKSSSESSARGLDMQSRNIEIVSR